MCTDFAQTLMYKDVHFSFVRRSCFQETATIGWRLHTDAAPLSNCRSARTIVSGRQKTCIGQARYYARRINHILYELYEYYRVELKFETSRSVSGSDRPGVPARMEEKMIAYNTVLVQTAQHRTSPSYLQYLRTKEEEYHVPLCAEAAAAVFLDAAALLRRACSIVPCCNFTVTRYHTFEDVADFMCSL